MGSLLSSHLFHLLTVKTAGHMPFPPCCRLHRKQAQYEPHRYRLSALHTYRMLHSKLSFSALRMGREAHTLCTPALFLYSAPGSHNFPHLEPYQAVPLPYSRCTHRISLLHKSRWDSHTVPHWTEVSRVLWSMPEYRRPHPLL